MSWKRKMGPYKIKHVQAFFLCVFFSKSLLDDTPIALRYAKGLTERKGFQVLILQREASLRWSCRPKRLGCQYTVVSVLGQAQHMADFMVAMHGLGV